LLAIAAYRTSSEHIASVAATQEADTFLGHLDELLSTVQEAEGSQRGYLLTGRLRYLEPFRRAQKTIQATFSRVEEYALEDDISKSAVQDLKTLIEKKMAEMQHTIELHDTGGAAASLAEVETDRGEQYMVKIRNLIQKLKNQQIATFNNSGRVQLRRQAELNAVLGAGVVLGLVLLALSYRFSGQYARERDQVEQEIRDLNNTLEARVNERTAELEERTRELETRSAELQRSNADLTQFAYVASHDLQEPLRMVGSYMGLLARRYSSQLDETAQKYIRYAVEGASRMQALIHDLLMYSRAGTQPLERTVFSANEAVRKALENLSVTIRENGAIVRYEALPEVSADEVKLTQVFQNLIGNGIKFRKPDIAPVVEVTAKRSGLEWAFEVADNGIGFDPKYCDRIFEVFQRLHGVGRYAGNGIGLAICRRVIEHHGGRLWADSQPGSGSRFFFTLPYASVPGKTSKGAEIVAGV